MMAASRHPEEMAAGAAPSGRGRWMADTESSICCSCAAPFTLLRRRHHCRRCGRLLCGDCSALRSPLAAEEMAHGAPSVLAPSDATPDGTSPSWRVCAGCYQDVLLTPLAAWGTAPAATRPLTAAEALHSLRALSALERAALCDLDAADDGGDCERGSGSLTQRWLASDGSSYHNGEVVPTGLAELSELPERANRRTGGGEEHEQEGTTAAAAGGRHAADISEGDEVHQALRAGYVPT